MGHHLALTCETNDYVRLADLDLGFLVLDVLFP